MYTSDGSTYSKQVSHFQKISGKSIEELSSQMQSGGMLAGHDWDEDMEALCRVPRQLAENAGPDDARALLSIGAIMISRGVASSET